MSNIKCQWCDSVYNAEENDNICPSCGARNEILIKPKKEVEKPKEIITEIVIEKKPKKKKSIEKTIKSIFIFILLSPFLCVLFLVLLVFSLRQLIDSPNFKELEEKSNSSNSEIISTIELPEEGPIYTYKVSEGLVFLSENNKLHIEAVRLNPETDVISVTFQSILSEEIIPGSLEVKLVDKNNNEYDLTLNDDDFTKSGEFKELSDILEKNFCSSIKFSCENMTLDIFKELKEIKIANNGFYSYFDLIDTGIIDKSFNVDYQNYDIKGEVSFNNNQDDNLKLNGISIKQKGPVYTAILDLNAIYYTPRDDYSPIKYMFRNNDRNFYIPDVEFYLIDENNLEYRLLSNKYYNYYEEEIDKDISYYKESFSVDVIFNFVAAETNFKSLKVSVDEKEFFFEISSSSANYTSPNNSFSITLME